MDNHEAIKMLTAKVECMRRETSGIDIDCNYRNCDECDLCYKQGTTGDQIEALCVAISALQAQDLQPTYNELAKDTNVPCKDIISRHAAIDALDKRFDSIPMEQTTEILLLRKDLRELPPEQPEIIRCKSCRFYMENINDEELKEVIEGFTRFMRIIWNNPNVTVPKDIAEKYNIDKKFCEKEEAENNEDRYTSDSI